MISLGSGLRVSVALLVKNLKSLLMNVKEKSGKVSLKLNIEKTKIIASGPINMANRWGNSRNSDRLWFFRLQNHCKMVAAAMKLKDACSLVGKL